MREGARRGFGCRSTGTKSSGLGLVWFPLEILEVFDLWNRHVLDVF